MIFITFRCAGKTGKVAGVKVSHGEDIASHIGLESCGATRKDGVEALAEERAGWVLSRENMTLLRKQQALQGADALEISGRQHRVYRYRQVHQDPARSKTPSMHGTTLLGNREIPRLSAGERTADRVGKLKDAHR
jgi:hypothetical protein